MLLFFYLENIIHKKLYTIPFFSATFQVLERLSKE